MAATSIAGDDCVEAVGRIASLPPRPARHAAAASIVDRMSIAKDDIRADWELGETLVVKLEGDDGDGTDGDGDDADGTDGGDTDGTDGDGTDGDGSDG